jgi:GNAT superfamily N-acetyltransferase
VIRSVDPATASDDLLEWMYELRVAAQREASPAEPVETLDRYRSLLRHPSGPMWTWVIGGVGYATLNRYPMSDTGFVRLYVAAAHRRRGAGRDLADELLHQARALGLPSVTSLYGTPAGEAFCAALGGYPGGTTVRSVLTLPSPAAPRPVPGYTLRSWSGRTPEELIESVAVSRGAIADAPFAGQVDPAAWTPEHLRSVEAAVLARGLQSRFTAALDRTGAAVAITELRLGPEAGAVAFTEDTSVVREHRRRGLALLVKAESLRWLAAERPDVTVVHTSNHATNTDMLEINRRLGFVQVGQWTAWFVPVSQKK